MQKWDMNWFSKCKNEIRTDLKWDMMWSLTASQYNSKNLEIQDSICLPYPSGQVSLFTARPLTVQKVEDKLQMKRGFDVAEFIGDI